MPNYALMENQALTNLPHPDYIEENREGIAKKSGTAVRISILDDPDHWTLEDVAVVARPGIRHVVIADDPELTALRQQLAEQEARAARSDKDEEEKAAIKARLADLGATPVTATDTDHTTLVKPDVSNIGSTPAVTLDADSQVKEEDSPEVRDLKAQLARAQAQLGNTGTEPYIPGGNS